MTTPESDSTAEKLFTKLRALKGDLPLDQSDLLASIIKVAREVAAWDPISGLAPVRRLSIEEQFDTAFTPTTVGLITGYATSELVCDVTDLDAFGARNAMIVKSSPAGVSSVDDDD
ncbi:hypothetical protein [Umezawaea sp. NPDC059074]|uniref:hypothetical protein n=1 Tax=Umezawaea sp. NPDC059074 TaxID=3346716 RepID=UPI0036CE3D7A